MSVQRGEIVDALRQFLDDRVLAGEVELDGSTELEAIGVDSITVIELVMHLEDRFGWKIPVEDLPADDLRSLGTLADAALRYAN
ncbi:MAG: acyl carrier protein [Flavobacteriales bacterium]|nr:acyl carrier protein [Flavobacteriales bacterium]